MNQKIRKKLKKKKQRKKEKLNYLNSKLKNQLSQSPKMMIKRKKRKRVKIKIKKKKRRKKRKKRKVKKTKIRIKKRKRKRKMKMRMKKNNNQKKMEDLTLLMKPQLTIINPNQILNLRLNLHNNKIAIFGIFSQLLQLTLEIKIII